jgi:hypothetical protein
LSANDRPRKMLWSRFRDLSMNFDANFPISSKRHHVLVCLPGGIGLSSNFAATSDTRAIRYG